MRSLLCLCAALIAVTSAWMPRAAMPVKRTLSSLSVSAPLTLDGQDIRGPITPLGNFILVKIKDTLTSTNGGILLPDQSKERPTEGLVLEAGPGKLHPYTGVRIANPIEVGMSVLYGKFDGKPVEYKGAECQMIRDDDVLVCYTGLTIKLETTTPVRDYVLIALDEKYGDEPVATKSGVVIAAQVMKDDVVCEGRVVKAGEGRMTSDGTLAKSPVQPYDMVKWKDYAGNDIIIEGKPYSVVKMTNILCTFTGKEVEE
jgi:chaperonin GroES